MIRFVWVYLQVATDKITCAAGTRGARAHRQCGRCPNRFRLENYGPALAVSLKSPLEAGVVRTRDSDPCRWEMMSKTSDFAGPRAGLLSQRFVWAPLK